MGVFPLGYEDFRVRRVAADDAERLSAFYNSLSAQTHFFFRPYPDISVAGMQLVVERAVSGADVSVVAVDPAGAVFAHLFLGDAAKECPHVGIGLREEYQSLGLGAPLLQYLLSMGRHVLKKKAVGLTVHKQNDRAFRLYRRLGFEVVREDVTFREKDDSYEMRLQLRGHHT